MRHNKSHKRQISKAADVAFQNFMKEQGHEIIEVRTEMSYALFKDGEQVSKAHSTRDAVIGEALAKKAIVYGSPDFIGKQKSCNTCSLKEGYEIRKLLGGENG